MIGIVSYKDQTKEGDIRRLESPAVLSVPLSASLGKPAFPVVEPGERVLKNQLIGRADGIVSAHVHSPVSGIVLEIKTATNISGKSETFIVLENDFREEALQLSKSDIQTPRNFVNLLKDAGIVGAGGAQFPTHVKFPSDTGKLKTFIINGAECEPYLTADFTLMKNRYRELMQVVELIRKVYQPDKVVLAIEKRNKELRFVFELYREICSVKLLPDSYPQGSELQLIHSVTGMKLKKTQLPISKGVLVSNVGTLYGIYKAAFEGIPFTERVVTVSGDNLKGAGNYWVKVGTPVRHVLASAGKISGWDNCHVVLGGPMMGVEVHRLDTPVSKGTSGVLALEKRPLEAYNCIQCGYCVDACPMGLMPMQFAVAYRENDLKAFEEYRLGQCIECGACEYICPSNVPLIDSIKRGKQFILENHK